VGLGFLVRLRFASRGPAMWRVCAIALSFVSGWRAFYSVSLCKNIFAELALFRLASLFFRLSLSNYICRGLFCALCIGFGFLVQLRFALRGLAWCRVCAFAPSFDSSWRAFSSCPLLGQRVPVSVGCVRRDACRRPGSDARSRPVLG
jgi:hypothetical protein